MESKINEMLKRISSENSIRIISVVEWGSRAYGLNSDKSDYDIRFVFIHLDDQLNIDARKRRLNSGLKDCPDVKQSSYTGTDEVIYNGKPVVLDWQGWDVTKAVKHLYEVNPSIVEWMFSPIVYFDSPSFRFIDRAKGLLNNHCQSGKLTDHYRSWAKSHYTDHIKSKTNEQVILKKYLICIRCSVMVLWLKLNRACKWKRFIEVNFMKVLENIKPHIDPKIYSRVTILIEEKKQGHEMVSREKILDDFIESTFKTDTHFDDQPKQRAYNRFLDSLKI